MNITALIEDVKLLIERSLKRIQLNKTYCDVYDILNNKYYQINDIFSNTTDNFKLREYYAHLLSLYELDILKVIKLIDNEKDYCNLDNEDTTELDNCLNEKISEIEKCVETIQEEYHDDKLIRYVKNWYELIMKEYQNAICEYDLIQRDRLVNHIKNDSNKSLTLYSSFKDIKRICFNKLTIFLDDFIKYLNELNKNNDLIKEKENHITNQIDIINSHITCDLTKKFDEIRSSYYKQVESIDLSKMLLGRLQNDYINALMELESDIKVINSIIANDDIIENLENAIREQIEDINKYLKTNLLNEFDDLQKCYYNERNVLQVFNEKFLIFQSTYVEQLKNFMQQSITKYDNQYKEMVMVFDNITYLQNTHPLFVDLRRFRRIKNYLDNNDNQVLLNEYVSLYYQMMLYELFYNKGESTLWDEMDIKIKVMVEKLLLEELEKDNIESLYMAYLKEGMTRELLSNYAVYVVSDIEFFEQNNVKLINYTLPLTKKFENNEIVIKVSDNYLLVKKDGSVIKLNIPKDSTVIDYMDGVLAFYDIRHNHYLYFLDNDKCICLRECIYHEKFISVNDDIKYALIRDGGTFKYGEFGNLDFSKYRVLNTQSRTNNQICSSSGLIIFRHIGIYLSSYCNSTLLLRETELVPGETKILGYYVVDILKNKSKRYGANWHCTSFSDGYAVVESFNKKHFVDSNFSRCLKDFIPIDNFQYGYAYVIDKTTKEKVYINTRGEIVSKDEVLRKVKEESLDNYRLYYNGSYYEFINGYPNLYVKLREKELTTDELIENNQKEENSSNSKSNIILQSNNNKIEHKLRKIKV